jgi:tellurite resistance protein TerC
VEINLKKLLIAVIGFLLIFIGILLLVLPGPGILLIILGLLVLATEFTWAKTIYDKFKKWLKKK